MSSYIQPGNVLDLAAPYNVAVGTGAKIGAFIFGVATVTLLSGVSGNFEITGVHDLAKDTADAFTAGGKVYWDDAQKNCVNSTSEGDLWIGHAVADASASATTVRVRLHGCPQ